MMAASSLDLLDLFPQIWGGFLSNTQPNGCHEHLLGSDQQLMDNSSIFNDDSLRDIPIQNFNENLQLAVNNHVRIKRGIFYVNNWLLNNKRNRHLI